jgi:hypothetical protein
MSKNINGPVNIIRLEGNINGINKILYVFLDLHIGLKSQTKCDDYLSDDVTKYIKEEMLKSDTELDFFMEHRMTESDSNLLKYKSYRDIYIDEMEKFFYDNFKNKTKELEKIRFHYADIRDSYIIFTHRTVNNILYDYSCANYNRTNIDEMLNKYKDTIDYLNNVIDLFDNKKIKNEITSIKEIKKIVLKYSIPEVKKNNKILIDLFIKNAKILIKMIDENYNLLIKHEKECGEYYNEIGNLKLVKNKNNKYSYFFNDTELINEIKNKQDKIVEQSMETYSLIMDIYFLRRFCDKKYVTNGIFYGGAAHGLLYINFLAHYYNFKVTHASYHLYDLEKTNKILKSKFYEDRIYNELFEPPVLIQCSNVSKFPEKFS